MNFSKLITTCVALGALAISSTSSALLVTMSAGTDIRTVADTNNDNQINAWETRINGWEVASATSIVDAGGFTIFSLTTSAIDRSDASLYDLTVVSLHEGFNDLRSLSVFHEDNSNTTSFSSLVEINFGSSWMELSDFTSGITDTGSYEEFATAEGTTDFDLRITQIFSTDGAAGTDFRKASGVTTVNVPEPSIIALLGLGLVGMGFAARRKQK